jgi:hypothetical protein
LFHHLAVAHLDLELGDLGDAQVAQRLGGSADGGAAAFTARTLDPDWATMIF